MQMQSASQKWFLIAALGLAEQLPHFAITECAEAKTFFIQRACGKENVKLRRIGGTRASTSRPRGTRPLSPASASQTLSKAQMLVYTVHTCRADSMKSTDQVRQAALLDWHPRSHLQARQQSGS